MHSIKYCLCWWWVVCVVHATKIFEHQYPVAKELKDAYDFIIVGAGTAGCALASRLSENPDWSVLLIEAGKHESITSDIPAAGIVHLHRIDWNYLSEPTDRAGLIIPGHRLPVIRGKVTGGTSTVNGMLYGRGQPKSFDRWRHVYHNKEWDWNQVEPYFHKMENGTGPEYGHNGPVHIEDNLGYETNFSRAFLAAVKEYGLNEVELNAADQIGFGRLMYFKKNGLRVSTNRAYLRPLKKSRPNLELVIHTLVERIMFDDAKHANGVVVRTKSGTQTIQANKEVIVCAGAVNTPKLLMLSGIGHKDHLEKLGIPVVHNLPVGDNVMEHAGTIALFFTINQTNFPVKDILKYIGKPFGPITVPNFAELAGYTDPNENGIQQLEYLVVEPPGALGHSVIFVVVSLQQSKSRGTVRLRSNNSADSPAVDFNLLSEDDEVDLLVYGIRQMQKIAKEPSLQALGMKLLTVPIPACLNGTESDSDEYIRCLVHYTSFAYGHISGTCKMGPHSLLHETKSVVNEHMQVHGVDNLRVCDTSIMPELIAGHTAPSAIMFAERLADIIKADWK